MTTAPSDRTGGMLAPTMWAIFLGVSWTWVIGMFVPVLLVRNFGLWGWVVFAIPNVVGAAAMGWLLRDAAASEQFVRRHAGACYLFSIVTIAYHLFFAMWMIHRLRGWGFYALAIYVAASLVPAHRWTRWAGAVGALIASVVMWAMLRHQGTLALPRIAPLGSDGVDLIALLCLAPVMIIGFALCPYLDLTFHRARQSTTPAGGRFAFGFGFGLVFCSMIVFTLMYARLLAPAVDGLGTSQLSAMFLVIHIGCQSAFTVAAHVRELPSRAVLASSSTGRMYGIATVLFLIAAAVAGWYASAHQLFLGHDLGEALYWCFLGCYGLIFPGYLWLTWRRQTDASGFSTRRVVTVVAILTLLAFPMYWMGFVERQPLWLVPGVALVLASRGLAGYVALRPADRAG